MPAPQGDDQRKAFLYFSVDVVDSVSYKARRLNEWPADFQAFLSDFPRGLQERCRAAALPNGCKRCLPPPQRWKTAGDEILMYVDIAEASGCNDHNTCERQYELALYYAAVVTSAIRDHNSAAYRRLMTNERAFLLKGAAWFANAVETSEYRDSCGNIVFPSPDSHEPGRRDFIGRQIDIGFRIAKYSTANRFVLSVEYAVLLLRDNYITAQDAGLRLYSDGRRPIKGVLEHLGYPILYIDMGDAFERAEEEVHNKRSEPADPVSLMRYLQEYIKRTDGLLGYPFISGDDLFG